MVERWNPWTDAAVMPMAESTHSHGNPTLSLTNIAGTTASASNGLTLSLSVAAPGAGSGTALNLTNLTGTLSANTAGISLSMSAAAPGAGGGFAAQGSGTYTQNTGTIQFANSNGITFGLAANQMTASHDGLTTAQPPGAYLTTAMLSDASSAFAGINGAITGGSFTLNTAGASINLPAYITTAAQADHSHGNPTLALTNLAGTTASASNGLTISLSHNISTAAASDHSHGNPTLALTNLTGTTASASNGLTISLAAAAPGAAAAVSQYGLANVFYGGQLGLLTNVTGTAVSLRCLLFPFYVPGQLTCQEVMWYMSRASAGSDNWTLRHGIYSFSNSSKIQSISTAEAVYSASRTASISGIRIWEMTPAVTTLTPGHYVLAMHFSGVSTASMNYSLMGHSTSNWNALGVVHPGSDQQTISANATSHQLLNFWGRVSVTTAAMPASIGLTDIWGIGTYALPVMFWFGTHN